MLPTPRRNESVVSRDQPKSPWYIYKVIVHSIRSHATLFGGLNLHPPPSPAQTRTRSTVLQLRHAACKISLIHVH